MYPNSISKNQFDSTLRVRTFNLTDIQFGNRISLFHWKGFHFNADRTLIFIFALLIFSLRLRVFPTFYANLSTAQYWGMSLFAGLGIAYSLIAHEAIHVLVARHLGAKPAGAFLYLFGTGTPIELNGAGRAKRTVLCVSGIILSALLSILLFGLAFLSETNGRNEFVVGILFHLGAFNITLAAFQLLPFLPLDGGRLILNLVSKNGSFTRGLIRFFYYLGSLGGLTIIALGGFQLYLERPVLGAWVLALGLTLLRANYEEYEYLTVKNCLSRKPIGNYTYPDVVAVQSTISLAEFSRDYLEKYPFKAFPVLSGNEILGFIYRNSPHRVSRRQWSEKRVCDVFRRAPKDMILSPLIDAADAWSLMVHSGNSRLLIAVNKRFLGMVSYGDLLKAAEKESVSA